MLSGAQLCKEAFAQFFVVSDRRKIGSRFLVSYYTVETLA